MNKFLPPQNIEAEQSLLGSLLLDKGAVSRVADYIKEDDFYQKKHSVIYQAIIDLFEKSESIDILSVSARLKERKELNNIGGATYLTELANSVPTSSHAQSYAKIIRHKRILRDLISAGQEIQELGTRESEDVESILDKAESTVFKIAQHSVRQTFLPIKTTLEETFDRIEALSKSQGGLRGVPTGFPELDNILSGLQKSDLIILAARPSMGKSAFAFNIATHVARTTKLPVGIFSLEMSRDQVVDRMIANVAGVDMWRLRTGRLGESDYPLIQHSLGVLSEAPVFVDDGASFNILQIRALARRLQAERGLGLIVVDYLQLMDSRNQQASSVQQMTEISRSLKGLAKELNIPVLALSQLSRAVEQRVPQIPRLSDLRESGSIEQDADVVMFIYREDRYRSDTPRKGIADIIIAKHRNGPVGKVELFFDEATVSFRSIEKHRTQD
jgi:replicative DNA helicase